eukprot:CAMPEP_0197464244 /NCGR_PEP_ID=MMETSP1175-20131217/63920_1 /TAXON_ID=1003142 /ORGANISM="Triceratium dubium, Strain CCMP147" /LENGTH=47 /DNA_ID= /DNA_START= /DNA_END= /DNA_ORIENTATION=
MRFLPPAVLLLLLSPSPASLCWGEAFAGTPTALTKGGPNSKLPAFLG